jgi:hypothetical protein
MMSQVLRETQRIKREIHDHEKLLSFQSKKALQLIALIVFHVLANYGSGVSCAAVNVDLYRDIGGFELCSCRKAGSCWRAFIRSVLATHTSLSEAMVTVLFALVCVCVM